jgi:hypothetical protein
MTRQKYKRIAILVIVGLALIELVMLGISFWRRQETLASENASEMLVRLSMADSALRSGDQAKFESMRNEFDGLRKKMERNLFAKTHYGAVIELADSYMKRISDDELIGELRLFLHARDNLLNDIASLNQDEYNYENQLKLKDYLADYAQVLNDLKVQQITDLVNAQKNATQAQRDAVENLLSCTGACTDADYIERQRQFEDALAQNLPIFEAQNDIFAEKFGASELATELSKIAKNS